VHLSETCDDDTPNLITNVETRPATEPDHDATEVIRDHLMANGYTPGEHFVDQGYMSIDHVVQQAEVGVDLTGAAPDNNSWQARQGGYDSRQFMIDWENECAVCPQGHTSCSGSSAQTRSQRPVVKIKFRHRDCAACPALNLCTDNYEQRRTLTMLAPQALYEAQQAARQRQQTADFKQACHVRAGV
jgi:transposase